MSVIGTDIQITNIENVGSDNTIIVGGKIKANDIAQISELLKKIKANIPADISVANRQSVNDSIENIEDESKAKKPKASCLRNALKVLDGIKAGGEFAKAVAELTKIFAPILLSL